MKKIIIILSLLAIMFPKVSHAQLYMGLHTGIGIAKPNTIWNPNGTHQEIVSKNTSVANVAGKVGFYAQFSKRLGLGTEVAYSTQEMSMNLAIDNKQIALPFLVKTLSFGLRPKLRLADRFSVVLPIDFGQSYFRNMENDLLIFYKSRFKSLEQAENPSQKKAFSYSGGIGFEARVTNAKSPMQLRVGIEAKYGRFLPTYSQKISVKYTLDGEIYTQSILENNGEHITTSLFIQVVFGKMKNIKKTRKKTHFRPRGAAMRSY